MIVCYFTALGLRTHTFQVWRISKSYKIPEFANAVASPAIHRKPNTSPNFTCSSLLLQRGDLGREVATKPLEHAVIQAYRKPRDKNNLSRSLFSLERLTNHLVDISAIQLGLHGCHDVKMTPRI